MSARPTPRSAYNGALAEWDTRQVQLDAARSLAASVADCPADHPIRAQAFANLAAARTAWATALTDLLAAEAAFTAVAVGPVPPVAARRFQ